MDDTTTTESSILIGHLADLHLRDTQYGTAKRGLDFFNAAKSAITNACMHTPKPDVLVLAGDIFDTSRPSPRVIGQLMELNALLQKYKMPGLTVTGNHDFTKPTWIQTLFPNASVSAGGIVPLDDRTAVIEGFVIRGVSPLTTNQFLDNIADVELATRDADVWIYHNFVTGVVPCYVGDKRHIEVTDLPVSPQNKAILLGDIHTQGYVRVDNDCLVGYPGSTEMCSTSEETLKTTPLIRVTKESAEVVGYTNVDTRKAIVGKVETPEELDALVSEVKRCKDLHPLVHVDFDRSLSETFTRLYAVLDTEKAILRCHVLPVRPAGYVRQDSDVDEESLNFDHFLSAMFKDSPLEAVVMSIFMRPADAANTLTDFIESYCLDTEE